MNTSSYYIRSSYWKLDTDFLQRDNFVKDNIKNMLGLLQDKISEASDVEMLSLWEEFKTKVGRLCKARKKLIGVQMRKERVLLENALKGANSIQPVLFLKQNILQ